MQVLMVIINVAQNRFLTKSISKKQFKNEILIYSAVKVLRITIYNVRL